MIREMAVMLTGNGSDIWVEHLERSAAAMENSDAWGLHRFFGAYGGAGSFNDIVLQRGARALVAENERFDHLRLSAWQLARRLRHDAIDEPKRDG